MDENESLAEGFEANRSHLRAVAYRILGSLNEADDAVQEAWLRLHRTDTSGVENLGGWLTTVVGRVCLDMLRSRTSRREEPLETQQPHAIDEGEGGTEPEHEALLADSVGLALLVVLDTLAPAERLAFVLHDLFAVPFDDIATILDRTPAATRQLASRARRRVQGRSPEAAAGADQIRRREVVDAFLTAARGGDFDALLAVLDPDVVLRADRVVPLLGTEHELRGRPSVLSAFLGRAQDARTALLDGTVGAAWAPDGKLRGALRFTIADGKVVAIDVVADPDQLDRLDVAFLDV
ncbi:sigma-70 family RNA polymerase sigma factor [Kitasatospora sp. GP82]|uniref:sigma-70 family RNA polymerase sigma factor n=1 Tax=Kitasatospora sp. GP82 TaxID=3035089 RepID=UPI002474856B|nr:sigma-70 family RNA polymerase sigma factor [Kitasatospora sp. GP82]MDH6126001.1 RNA polymerase sigma factor (sigma-70 family) [Kitasatospora sp. GP82]